MKWIHILLFVIPLGIVAQDNYHNELTSFLLDEHGLENGAFVVADNELENINAMYIYGAASKNTVVIADQSFEYKVEYNVTAAGDNQWDAGTAFQNSNPVSQGDIILLSFWGRRVSNETDLFLFAENSSNFEKEVYFNMQLTQDWAQYFIPFK
ncbi:MAG: hypothetical protein AAGK97_14795, partial [Bacteroidota bacterium]